MTDRLLSTTDPFQILLAHSDRHISTDFETIQIHEDNIMLFFQFEIPDASPRLNIVVLFTKENYNFTDL